MAWAGKSRKQRGKAVLALGFLYSIVNSEGQDEQKALSKLEHQVEQWEEVQGADDFWGKGNLEDGRAQLDVLAAGLHAHCPPAAEGGGEN